MTMGFWSSIMVLIVLCSGFDVANAALRSKPVGFSIGGALIWSILVVVMIQCLCRGY